MGIEKNYALLLEYLSNSRLVTYVFYILVVLFLGNTASKLLHRLFYRIFEKRRNNLEIDATNFSFLKNAISAFVFVIEGLILIQLIPELRNLGLSLFASAGIITVIIGFASQQAFANIIGGVFIVIFRPFRVGDYIQVGTDKVGTVEDITLRHTVVCSIEGRRYVIPNSVISSESILNSTIADTKVLVFVEVTISYDADLDKAMLIMHDEALNHPSCIDARSEEDQEKNNPIVVVRVLSLNQFGVKIRASVWAETSSVGFAMKCDLLKQIKLTFDKNDIHISRIQPLKIGN